MRVFLLFVLMTSVFLVCSCKKYKPAAPAFFIKASDISVTTNAQQGSGSHKITDLWLYVNGQFKGVYPVGNLMPIPTNQTNDRINISAGIKNNGINETRVPWDFYLPFEFDTLVESGKTISRSFAFEYSPSVKFAWTENFESPGFQVVTSSGSAANFYLAQAAESFEGKSLKLEIPSSHANDIAQVESSDYYTVPKSNRNVYLELNYKCNAPVDVGLVGNLDPVKKWVMRLNPTVTSTKDAWNKIYIQLATMVNTEPVSGKYKVYFQIIKNASYTNPKMFLDNIKLVYIP